MSDEVSQIIDIADEATDSDKNELNPSSQLIVEEDETVGEHLARVLSRTPQHQRGHATTATPLMRNARLDSTTPTPVRRSARTLFPELEDEGNDASTHNAAVGTPLVSSSPTSSRVSLSSSPSSARDRNRVVHSFNPSNEDPNTLAAQRAQADMYTNQTRGSPVGQFYDGRTWRTAFQVFFVNAGQQFRVLIGTTPPTRQLQVTRSKVTLGRGTMGAEMIDWLVNVAELLGRAWNVRTGDQDDISRGMLVRWNEEWHSRGTHAGNPLVIDDDDDAAIDASEDVVEVPIKQEPIIKQEPGARKQEKKGKKQNQGSGGYHGPRRRGFGPDENGPGAGGSSGGDGSSLAQAIEIA